MALECLGCKRPARWHVWYKGFSSPTFPPPFPPANIAYNSFCDECSINEMKVGRKGYHVDCVQLIADSLLPEGDRAKEGKKIVE